MNQTLKLLLLSGFVSAPSAVMAQDQAAAGSEEIEDIVVTASRRPQPLSSVGASISVIDEQALEDGQYTFVIDALQTLPSMAISPNGAFGGQTSISIRGADTGQTVILVDGVHLNDVSSPGGGFNFGTLDTSGIERIEVLKGPQAVLYGSDAIGGVVNIITKTGGHDGFGGSAYTEYGAFDSLRLGGNVHGGSEQFGFNLSVGYSNSDGISKADGGAEADGHENITLRGRVTAQLSDTVELEAFGSYSDSDTEVDGFGPSDSDVDMALSEEYLVGGRLHLDLLGGDFVNTVSVEYSGIDRASVSAFGTFPGKGQRLNLDYLGVYAFDENWSLTAGAQHESVKAETVTTESVYINSVFGVVAYEQDGLHVSGGLRYDDHEEFGSSTNGQIRAAYTVAESGTKVFANWGEGFKAPSLNQLTYICTFCFPVQSAPNTNLLPEESNAWELGVEQTIMDGAVKLGATYFDQKTKNLIEFVFAGATTADVGYVNTARARSKGIEVFLDAQLSEAVSFTANYTHNSAKNRDTDAQLIRRPKNKAYAALTWDMTEKFSTNISVTHNGEIQDTAAIVDDWTVIDLRVSYQLNDSIELYGRVNNLFDETYQRITGYGTPGISSFFGVRGKF